MYFSVGNRVKMGARRLGYAKYNSRAKTTRFIHKNFFKKNSKH